MPDCRGKPVRCHAHLAAAVPARGPHPSMQCGCASTYCGYNRRWCLKPLAFTASMSRAVRPGLPPRRRSAGRQRHDVSGAIRMTRPGPAIRSTQLPSGEDVPVLGQGTWYMAEDARRRKEEIAALRTGIDLGMTLIDTAEMYTDGQAEELVGEAID